MMVTVLILCASVGSAQTAEELLDRVHDTYASVQDARVHFSQHVKFAMAKLEQNITGTLYLKKKNKYRVELDEQTIITNGETVWSFSPLTNQVLIDHFDVDEQSLTPERVLTGAPGDFSATLSGREKLGRVEVNTIKLIPKNQGSFIISMKLWIDPKEWLIRKVELVDQNGKTTEYVVNEIKVNIGLKDSSFTYQIPEGVEVVDLR